MAIKREDFDIGGTVLVVTRTGNGAAVMYRRRKAKVLDINRAACVIEWCDDPKKPHVTLPFKQLEPDPEWLDLRDQKRAARAKLLEDEKRVVPSLTYSLGEKLAQEDEPPPRSVSEQERERALSQIAELRKRDSTPPPTPAQTPPQATSAPPPVEPRQLALPTPSQAAPTGWTGDIQALRDGLQAEIDQLEEEQRALLEMLVPVEQKLSVLKKRRKAMREYGQAPRLKWPDPKPARRIASAP